MHDLTGFQRDLLYIIAGDSESPGPAVKAEMEDYYDESIRNGRLYPSLNTLVEEGLIEKKSESGRANIYTLTQDGRRAIKARRSWEVTYEPSQFGSEIPL